MLKTGFNIIKAVLNIIAMKIHICKDHIINMAKMLFSLMCWNTAQKTNRTNESVIILRHIMPQIKRAVTTMKAVARSISICQRKQKRNCQRAIKVYMTVKIIQCMMFICVGKTMKNAGLKSRHL